jgi:DNA polymerase-3 subunit epsilon
MILPFELDRPLAFLDLETTGLSIVSDRIIELAIIRVSPQGDVLERVRRFNPGVPIPPSTGSQTRTWQKSLRFRPGQKA